jgi:hypothetical protein
MSPAGGQPGHDEPLAAADATELPRLAGRHVDAVTGVEVPKSTVHEWARPPAVVRAASWAGEFAVQVVLIALGVFILAESGIVDAVAAASR